MKKLSVTLLIAISLLGSALSSCKSGQPGVSPGKGGKGGNATLTPKIRERVDFLFVEANTQYMQENYREAINLFKQVLEIDPTNHASVYNIGKINFELSDLDPALASAKKALEMDPENYWYYELTVSIYEQMLNYPKALEVQQKLAEKFPEDKNALFDLAQLYIQENKFEKATEVYEKLEAIIGMNEEVVFRKHQLYDKLNRPEDALAELEKLIRTNPGDPRYFRAKYELLINNGKEEEAVKVLEDLLVENPNDGYALLSLADHYKTKGNLEKSDQYLYQAFGNPEISLDAKIRILTGLYPYAQRDEKIRARMVKLGNLLEKTHPGDPMVYGVKGKLYQWEGKTDSARIFFRKAIKGDPTNQELWQELIFMDSEVNDFDALKKDAEEALEYYPNQTLFLFFFGVGSAQAEEFEEAVYAFEKIKKVGTTNLDLLTQVYTNLADIYHQEEEYEKSDEHFDLALELDSENPLILNNYAYYLSLRNENLEKALEMSGKTLKKEPNSSAYQDTYGWILYQMGKYEKAKVWIGKAVENGGSAEVLEHYGDVWFKLGDRDKAIEYWNKAKDKGAKDLVIDDKLKL